MVDSAADSVNDTDNVLALREANLAANAGGPGSHTIKFDPGVFTTGTTIHLTMGEMVAQGNLKIEGLGPDRVSIDAVGNSRIFVFNDGDSQKDQNVLLTRMNLRGGSAADGGAIYNNERRTLDRVFWTNNTTSALGGAIYSISNAALTIRNSVLAENSSSYSGGALFAWNNQVEITQSVFTTNKAAEQGGAYVVHLYGNKASFTLANTTISQNSSGQSGGGAAVWTNLGANDAPATVTMRNNELLGNQALDGFGGGLYVDQVSNNSSLTLNLQKNTFAQNQSNGGGAIMVDANAPQPIVYTMNGWRGDSPGWWLGCGQQNPFLGEHWRVRWSSPFL